MDEVKKTLNYLLTKTIDEEYEKGLYLYNNKDFKIINLTNKIENFNFEASSENNNLWFKFININNYDYYCECNFHKKNLGFCRHFVANSIYIINNELNEDFLKNILISNNEENYSYFLNKDNSYISLIKKKTNSSIPYKQNLLKSIISKIDNELKLNSFEVLKLLNIELYFDDETKIVFGDNVNIEVIISGNNREYKTKWLFKDSFSNIINFKKIYYSIYDIAILDMDDKIRIINLKSYINVNNLKNNSLIIENQKDFFTDTLIPLINAGIKINLSNSDLEIIPEKPKFKLYIFRLEDRFKFLLKIIYFNKEFFLNELDNRIRFENIESIIINKLKEKKLVFDNNWQCIVDADFIVEFFDNIINELPEEIKIIFSKKLYIDNKPLFGIKTNYIDNNIKVDISVNNFLLNDYIDQIRKNKNYVVLKDGSIINIPENIKKLVLKIKRRKEINIIDFVDIDYEINGEITNILDKLSSFEKITNYDLENFKGNLRTYQKYGYNYLKFLYDHNINGIIADDMGLGKTIQVIALLSNIEINNRILIVCPKSIIYNWNNEIDKFSYLKANVYIGSNRIIDEKKIIITTYSTLKSSEELYNIYYDYIIIDEAQNMKNHWTETSKILKKLSSRNKLALTGTPIENSLADLWNIFDFLYPDYLDDRENFLKNNYNLENKNNLIRKIKPFLIRRTKEQVLKDLPEKIENDIYIEMTEEQSKLYNSYVYDYLNKYNNNDNKIAFFTFLTKLRQICCHPKLIKKNYLHNSSKMEYLKDFINHIIKNNHKLILFSQFTKMLDIIQDYLKCNDIDYEIITGKTNKRLEIVDNFNKNKNIHILLLSLRASGSGLNITGADYVLHYDPWWNPSVENQATDRAHRIGQMKNVNVYKLITKNSIEEKIQELKSKKFSLQNNILNNKSLLKELTKEDIMNIIS